MKKQHAIALAAALVLSLAARSQTNRLLNETPHFSAQGLTFYDPEKHWVDSVLATLSLEERIAQTMIVRVPLNMDDAQAARFSAEMNGYGVGGVCFFAGTAERQVAMTRRFQADARVPLLVSIDGEWGLGMRLKDMYSFPRNARFGQLPDNADSIVYRMGEEIGRQCRMMGIHINYAPVVDINSNPKNPVIGTRAFSNDRERAARLGIMYALGQQSQGVMAVAKHFPGHGDTDKDSHFELPVIKHSRAKLDSVELYPFKRLIDAGVGGVMVAHLQVNAYDSVLPSSLSPAIITDLLKDSLGFDGLVITDGIDMKGITNSYGGGAAELAALRAGNDIILLPPNVQQSVRTIAQAAQDDPALREAIDYHCRRILLTKYRLVLPTLGEAIEVPGPERRQACEEIVGDLNLSLDRRIDSVVTAAMLSRAMPGCQIVVLHKGRKIVDRCYGHLTYDLSSDTVTNSTLYDLASLTKVCATTLAIMKLVDDDRLSINDRLSKYLPYLKHTNKSKITVKQVMSHCARLKAFAPFWKDATGYDSVLRRVADSPLTDKEEYLYSDLGFMLLSDVVRHITGQPLDVFMYENFYHPMGLKNIMFNPLTTLPSPHTTPIAPTEEDAIRGLINGEVHDPNAYAMGGVSGHAGLFATADDVAQLMQMLLDGGEYHGHRYLSEKIVKTFNTRHFAKQGNRRALGFDKPLFSRSAVGHVCPEASQASFGHSGFTGTMLWVDPEYQLVYVFLSNRVHPTANPNLLARMNVRTDIQSAIYKLIKSK